MKYNEKKIETEVNNENSIFITVKNDCPNKLPTVKRLKKVDDNVTFLLDISTTNIEF